MAHHHTYLPCLSTLLHHRSFWRYGALRHTYCMQIQGIEEVSAISVIGTIGMAWALGVIAVKLCITPKVAGYVHTRLFPQLRSFGDVPELLVAVFDTVFTFGGQVNWLRYLMSMQQKRKFPLAVANVSAVMEGAALRIFACCRLQMLQLSQIGIPGLPRSPSVNHASITACETVLLWYSCTVSSEQGPESVQLRVQCRT